MKNLNTNLIKESSPVGMKFDSGKPEYSLLPAYALEEVVKVLTYGAGKYAPENWRHVTHPKARYFNATQRHLWATSRGEMLDPETGLHHISHAICSLMFLHEHLNKTNTVVNPFADK